MHFIKFPQESGKKTERTRTGTKVIRVSRESIVSLPRTYCAKTELRIWDIIVSVKRKRTRMITTRFRFFVIAEDSSLKPISGSFSPWKRSRMRNPAGSIRTAPKAEMIRAVLLQPRSMPLLPYIAGIRMAASMAPMPPEMRV